MRIGLLFLALTIGCAKATGPRVQPFGPGLFTLSVESNEGIEAAREVATDEASAFCETRGKGMHVENERSSGISTLVSIELVFDCVVYRTVP